MQCPHCQTFIPTEGLDPGQWVSCGECHATVQAPDREHSDAALAAGDTFFEDRKAAQQRMFRTFRYQSLLVAGLVAVVLLLIVGYAGWQAKGRREAAEAIRDLGGVVLYNYQFNDDLGRFSYSAEPKTWVWLHDLFGPDVAHDVTAVDLGRSHSFLKSEQFGEQDMSAVDVPDFEPAITGAALNHLQDMEFLQLLSLEGQPITDRGLRRIKHLDQLVYVDLRSTKITDKAVATLASLRRLKFLDLRGTDVTDDGYRNLTSVLPNTQILRGRAFFVH